MQDLERDGLRTGLRDGAGGWLELDDVALREPVRRPGGAPVDESGAVPEQPGRRRPRELRRLLGKEAVGTVVVPLGDEPDQAGLRRRRLATTSRATPTEIALSATLNTGHQCTVTKSVTEPCSTRS